jgi:hypothetical protein
MRIFVTALSIGGTALVCVACVIETPLRPVSARAQAVHVEEGDPPAGAQLVGPIEGTDGSGCAFDDARGTLRNATTALKEAAVRSGADFVKVTKVTKPYSGHECYHQEFKLEGLAYRVHPAPAAPLQPAPPAPAIAVAAPAIAAAPAADSASPQAAACTPPCSPGYACEAGVCRALCNPACGAQQTCRADRVCVPAPGPSAAQKQPTLAP